MMRKSAWLLSAGLVALTTPTFARGQSQPASPADQQAAQPKPGTTTETAAVQNQAKERQPVDTSDIVITATRRNQALSDVPMAVSAVTAQTLRYTGANDIRQLNQVAPSLLVSSTSSEAGAAVARIRGIGTVGDNPGLESSVGVFIDGVYRSRTGIGLTDLGALDRIEVLRGPQGTLFGRNTSAGLISIITAKPRFEPEISGQVDVGNYGLVRLEGSATGPIASTLAVRLDAVYDKRNGFLKDVISGRRVNGRDRWMVRGQLLYQPSDNFSFRLIGDYSHQHEECCAATYLPAHDVVTNGAGGVVIQPSTIAAIERGLGAVINDDTFARDVSITPGRSYRSNVNDGGISGEANLDLGWGELTSITAYRYNKYVRGQDADFNNLDILYRDDGGGSYNRFKTFTQELRLQGKAFDNHLDWLIGGYYANEKLRVVDNLAYGSDYSRFANCLVAANFAGATGQAGLIDTANPTCFNPLVANAVLPFLPAAQQPVLSAFARLGLFAAPIFNNSGFSNIATANGLPGQSMDLNAINDAWNQTSNNWALFTHNIISITDNLKFTAGLRYTHERKTLNASLSDNNVLCSFYSAVPALQALQTLPCVNPSAPGGAMSLHDALSESRLSGTGVLSYKIGRLLTYASYSRGYKAGGFNLDRSALDRVGGNGAIIPTTNADALKFKPETNEAFEIGAKFNGRGVDINVAVFRELFKNFQLNTFNGLNFVVENINSCSNSLNGADSDNDPTTGACTGSLRAGVRSQGFELEAFTRPISNLQWNAGVTLADTKYRGNLVGADGVPLTNALFQLPDRRVSNAPKWTVTSSLAFTPPIGGSGLRALFYIDGRYMSSFNTGSDLDIEKTQKAFTVFNGRVGIHGPDDTWGVEFWAQNMFNKHFIQVAFDAPIQGSGTTRGVEAGFYPVSTQLYGAFLGEPRTFGLTLRTKIGFHRAPPPAYVPPAPPPPPPPPPVVEQPAPPPPPPPPAAPERG